jgi:hypothetical protein
VALAAGFVAGALAGAAVWSAQIARSRRELFNTSPVRRLAALGYLNGRCDVETLRLLTDYVGWERHPMLRRRAHRIIRRITLALG